GSGGGAGALLGARLSSRGGVAPRPRGGVGARGRSAAGGRLSERVQPRRGRRGRIGLQDLPVEPASGRAVPWISFRLPLLLRDFFLAHAQRVQVLPPSQEQIDHAQT